MSKWIQTTLIPKNTRTIVRPEYVNKLKERLSSINIDHHKRIIHDHTFEEAHIYCILNNLSSQQYGPLLEKYFQVRFGYTKNNSSDRTGDLSKNGINIEIKVSLGGKSYDKFNFVQIRPSHEIKFYILTAYYYSKENADFGGELYIFKILKYDICYLILRYGDYSHGTIDRNGPITLESLNDSNVINEYSIRPRINDTCWKDLLKFRIDEKDL